MKYLLENQIIEKLYLVESEKYGVNIKGARWIDSEISRRVPVFDDLAEANSYFPSIIEYANMKIKFEHKIFDEENPLDFQCLAIALSEISDEEFNNFLQNEQLKMLTNEKTTKFDATQDAFMVLSSTKKGSPNYSVYDFSVEGIFSSRENAKKFQEEFDKKLKEKFNFSVKSQVMSLSELNKVSERQKGE